MKKLLYLTVIIICLAACKKDKSAYQSQLDQSLRDWQVFKASANNSYRYTVYNYMPIGITAPYTETTITVINGQPVARIYQARVGGKQGQLLESFTEDKFTVGTNVTGALPLTIDQVYENVHTKLADYDQTKGKISVEVDANGLLGSAYYRLNDCSGYRLCEFGTYVKDIVRM